MDNVTAKLAGNRRFVAWDEAGHSLVMDSKREYSGDDTGMRPLQVALAALAGCTGMDVIGILRKQRQDVRDFEVRVTAEQRAENPKIYTKVNVDYVLTGKALKPEFVERAIRLSEDQYCSVRAMFGPQVALTSEWHIEEVE